jgi:hypothetical protein
MRTTLDIEDDVLQAAKELAAREGSTAGKVLSALARKGLTQPPATGTERWEVRDGVPILPSRGEIVTPAFVQRIMDEEGI